MNYNLAIIGGGPAGYTAAEIAGLNGLKTVIFDKRALGGVCLNEGCIPTKTLLYSAKILSSTKESAKYGIDCDNIKSDLSKIIARKNKVVRKLNAGVRAKMRDAGVEIVIGQAMVMRISAEGIAIGCNGQTYIAKKLLLGTGSEVVVPPVSGIKETGYWTSREALENKELPQSLAIIGGGVIGIEFASFFNSMGTKVTVVEMMDEILGGMDKELSAILRNEFTKKGIDFYLNAKVISVNNGSVEIEKNGSKSVLETEKILLSVGRKPVLTGFGMENLNLETYRNGLKVNEYMQTSNNDIYACGDITGFSLLAHTAVREAEIAVEHILGNQVKMSYKAIPGVVYTNPEFSGVGKTEEMLQSEGAPYRVKKLPLAYSGRFIAENETANGICKVILAPDDTILGVHILGNP
jgi:dihydrolipoamide dehydrogenase